MGRGRGVARREGGAQQAGPHPLTRAHAHPPNAHNPRDGLADPHPSRAPRARRRTARSVPGSREEVGDHAHARTRAAARRGRRSPTPRGDPDVRAASERRTAVPGPGDSRARAAAAPAHASGRGPGPGRGPAPSPAGGRGRRGGARHSTAKGKATKAGRRARPARDGGPGPGPRAPGRAPPPGPGGRASDRPGGGRPSHTSHEHLPGRDHRAALGRTHAPNGATPRGERTGLPPPRPRRRRRPRPHASGEGRSRPGKRGAPGWGGPRADPMRKSGPGQDETPGEAGGQAGRGGAGGRLRRSRPPPGHTRGSHRQQPPSTKAAPRGTWSGRPGLQRSLRLPHRHAQSHAARAPGARFPPHAPQGRPKPSGRPPGRHRPGPEGARRGGTRTPGQPAWPAAATPPEGGAGFGPRRGGQQHKSR